MPNLKTTAINIAKAGWDNLEHIAASGGVIAASQLLKEDLLQMAIMLF